MSAARRKKLEDLLQREELTDAVVTRLQVESPAVAKTPDIRKVVEAQVKRLMNEGEYRPRSAGRVRKDLKEILSSRPATPQGEDVRLTADTLTGRRPSSASAASRGSRAPAEGPKTAASGAGRTQTGLSTGRRTERVKLPMYTVMSRRIPLERLLQEKIQQRGKSGANQIMKQFKVLDRDGSGSVDQDELKTFLGHYNVQLKPDVLRNFMRKYDKDGDGTIDYLEFVKHVLPEDFPDNSDEKEHEVFALAAKDSKKSSRASTPAAPNRLAYKKRPMSVEQIEETLRQKINQRTRGGPFVLRQAFKFFDKDGSGQIDYDELKEVLDRFNIHPDEKEFKELMEKYDQDKSGDIDYYEFIGTLMPTDAQVSAAKQKEVLKKARETIGVRFNSLRGAFRKMDADGNGYLDLDEITKMAKAENLGLNEHEVAALTKQMDADGDGKISYAEFCDGLQEVNTVTLKSEYEKRKPKSIMDGFDKSHPYINGTNKYRTPAMKLHMEIPQIEGMLRDKLQSRLKGGPGGLRRAFKHFDTDGSGTISHEELHQVLQNFNMNLKDGDFDSLMMKYDEDGTGEIDYYEFIRKLLPKDYTSRGQQLQDKADGDLSLSYAKFGTSLEQLDKYVHGYRKGYIPEHELFRVAKKSGIVLTPELEQTLRTLYAEEGEIDYVAAMHACRDYTRMESLKAIEADMRKQPMGMYELLTAGDSGRRPKKPAKEPKFQHTMTTTMLEQLIHDKIRQRCKGGARELRYAFKHFDKDGSGEITYDEFIDGLEKFNIKVSAADLKKLIKVYDPEDAGQINFINFINRLMPPGSNDMYKTGFMAKTRNKISSSFQLARRAFREIDVDGSGQIDKTELMRLADVYNIKIEPNVLEDFMALQDADGSGTLNYDEFIKLLESQKLQELDRQQLHDKRKKLYSPTPKVDHFVLQDEEIDVPDDTALNRSGALDGTFQSNGQADIFYNRPAYTPSIRPKSASAASSRGRTPPRPASAASSRGRPVSGAPRRPMSAGSARPMSAGGARPMSAGGHRPPSGGGVRPRPRSAGRQPSSGRVKTPLVPNPNAGSFLMVQGKSMGTKA